MDRRWPGIPVPSVGGLGAPPTADAARLHVVAEFARIGTNNDEACVWQAHNGTHIGEQRVRHPAQPSPIRRYHHRVRVDRIIRLRLQRQLIARPELIDRTLQMTISGEVRTQNAPYVMRGILLNKDAREKAWSFMKVHWEEMLRRYPDNSIPRMCEGIIGLVTPELEADVRDFFAKHPVKQGGKQMEQHLERLLIAVACKERWKDLLRP